MTDSQKVDLYIEKQSHWTDELVAIRAVFNATELVEEVKWGTPSYSLNGKLIAGMAAFKNHMGIWFHQGVFLKDTARKLVNAQEGKTKALRQWRIQKGDDIDKTLIAVYIQEAIENSLAGKEIKPARKKGVTIPPFLKDAFKTHQQFESHFKVLTPGKQREYCEYIAAAKKAATKESRLQKIIPMIADGKGLHDKYKNC